LRWYYKNPAASGVFEIGIRIVAATWIPDKIWRFISKMG
jgi:hypothetical protein